ncbi:MAG: tetratricopeptide repeat protein [Anaerolineales bacterium]
MPTDKTRALLAYLALTPDTPLRRERLAGLLWPDQPETQARQNLRKTIGRLKQAVHDRDPELAASLLSVTKETVELALAECEVDVAAFRRRLEAARKHSHPALEQCSACLDELETAAGLYRRGEFLAGLSLPDAAPFEEWLLLQRENLYGQQLGALQRLAGAYEQQGVFVKASQAAQWQIQLEPWREEAHRLLMRVLAVQGQRAEAIAQYQVCRRVLQAELGVAPSPETEALLTQIMDGSLVVAAAQTTARPQPWPRLAGALIGREAELDRVLGLLALPACRVLTITGLGGIGKTSLALAVGERLSQALPPWLADGVYLGLLAEVTEAGGMPAAVAAAVGLTLNQRLGIAAQVAQYLRSKALLLILDNVEQLALGAGWLRNLAASAPRLKLLLTSREPLNWQDEWRYPLEGLTYPDAGADGARFEAVRLFVQAAQKVKPGFAYSAENGPAIARICQLVQGWPLALQMAAGWVQMMSCQAIAGQISASLDFLAASLHDLPLRQRSMRAIFEHTWATLNEDERRLMARLAVFRGGYDLAAAMEVAGAAPVVLRGLVDKSLVRHDDLTHRFSLHDMLRQFALEAGQAGLPEPDAPAATALAQRAHSRYYLALLEAEGQRLFTTEFRAALEVIRADLDNLHQAWLWAASGPQAAELTPLLGRLAKFYEGSGLPQEAVAFFRRTLAAVEEAGGAKPAAFIAHIHCHIADSLRSMGHSAEAESAIRVAQAIARALDDGGLTNTIFIAQAHLFREQGRYGEAHAVLREAIASSQARDDPAGVAGALHIQGNVYWSMAAYEQARQSYEDGRRIYEQLGDANSMSVLTGNIGVVLWRQGRLAEALSHYEVALAAQRQVGNESRIAIWLGNTGLVYVDLQDDEQALRYLDEALTMHEQLGRKFYKFEVLLGKATVLLRRGEVEAATALHRQAAELALFIGNRTYLLICDLWQARFYAAQGRASEAAQLLQALQTREFRPDVAASIARELERLPYPASSGR